MTEDQIFAKMAKRLLPFVMLLYVVNYIDRVNVGFAALTMNKDLGLSPAAYGFGASIFFVGYLISIALFGLFQAIFMANAGGAWDNAKKIVETELKAKGTPLHDATVVGDTVGDPFKDTSSVALNPIIKFTTLFGLLAVELSVALAEKNANGNTICHLLAALCLLIALFFVYRSFYGMRIGGKDA